MMKNSGNRFAAIHAKPSAQRGIVLILALILLVVISTTAVLAVKGSMSGEQVSNNLRTSSVATQSAESALRYCETQVMTIGTSIIIKTDTPVDSNNVPNLWATKANWTSANANTVTAVIANSSDSAGRQMSRLPICMVEDYPIPPVGGPSGGAPRQSYLVTARGFSQDYQTNSSGQVISGSEVWMQSILRQ